jgi:ferredoxin-type protein NapF
MSQMTSRRAFLSARALREDPDAIRPPGAVATGFSDLCTRCEDCAAACPEDIITFDDAGFPVLDLSAGGCTLCGDCADNCPTPALLSERVAEWPWRARIDDTSCLSTNGVSCRLCQDNCEQDAIRFRLQLGGRAEPALETETCIGCGSCSAACPAGAIVMHRPAPLHPEVNQ